MNPRIVIGLTSLLLWLPGLFLASGKNKTLGVIVILFIMLSYFLFTGSRRAFHIYRGFFWLFVIGAVIVMFIAMSGALNTLYSPGMGLVGPDFMLIFWMILQLVFAGSILYYSGKDHVRAAYGLEPKKKREGNPAEQTVS